MAIRCSICGRDLDAIGHDNMSYSNSMVLCEDCCEDSTDDEEENIIAAVVTRIPVCCIDGCGKPAEYDAQLRSIGTLWGYVCKEHFDHFECELGTGIGQKLILCGSEEDPNVL